MAAVISTVAGTRTTPIDGLIFIRGTTAIFKIIFQNGGIPSTVDVGTKPILKIVQPKFLSNSGSPLLTSLAVLEGELEVGQNFEYKWEWEIPIGTVPTDQYIASYNAEIGGMTAEYGQEFFTIQSTSGVVNIKPPAYATVDDVRKKKFNIDDYLPKFFKDNLTARNDIIEDHLRDATQRLREELNLSKSRSNSENYRLFAIYYTVWSIMLASRGEDGSSVSDSNLIFWRTEWERILSQEKREGVLQGVPLGRG